MSRSPLRRRLIAALLSLVVLAVVAPATASAAAPEGAPSAAPRAASPFDLVPGRASTGGRSQRRGDKVVAGVAIRVIITGVKAIGKKKGKIRSGARKAAPAAVRAKLRTSTFNRTFKEARLVVRRGPKRFKAKWLTLSDATRGCIYGIAQSRASRFANDGTPDYWLRLYDDIVDSIAGDYFLGDKTFSKPSAATLAVEFGKDGLIDAGGCAAGIAYGPFKDKLIPPGT